MTHTEEQLWLENIQLRQQAHYYQSLHERAVAKHQEFLAQITVLQAKVAELQQRLFGRKSERKYSSEAWAAQRRPPRPRGQQRGQPGHGRQMRATVPVEDVVIPAPLGDRVCRICGGVFEPTGTQAAHAEIAWEARIVKKRYHCQRYERTCQCPQTPALVVAPAPPQLIPKGLLSLGTIVELLLLKFEAHLPLQRIVTLAARYGLPLSPGTVCGIWQTLPPLLFPLYLALVEATRETGRWLMDETRWEVFAAVEGKASHRWWLWVVVSPRSRVYLLRPTRGASVPEEFFGWQAETQTCQYGGTLMVDRFASYKFLVAALLLAFCWAHVRRDFLMLSAGADPEGQRWAGAWIERIGELYHLNGVRLELGQDLSLPALPAPFVQVSATRMRTPEYGQAQQALAQALTTMVQIREEQLAQPTLPLPRRKILESLRAHWEGLTLFLDHPEIPLDNNGAERAGRTAAVGRKNYYGSGAEWSGQLMAMLLTVFQTLALHGVEARGYLTAYLEACAVRHGLPPTDLTPWLPWNFKAAGASVAPVVATARAP